MKGKQNVCRNKLGWEEIRDITYSCSCSRKQAMRSMTRILSALLTIFPTPKTQATGGIFHSCLHFSKVMLFCSVLSHFRFLAGLDHWGHNSGWVAICLKAFTYRPIQYYSLLNTSAHQTKRPANVPHHLYILLGYSKWIDKRQMTTLCCLLCSWSAITFAAAMLPDAITGGEVEKELAKKKLRSWLNSGMRIKRFFLPAWTARMERPTSAQGSWGLSAKRCASCRAESRQMRLLPCCKNTSLCHLCLAS